MCNSLASIAAMTTETIQAHIGDDRFSVRLRSPSAKEAYWMLSRRKSQAQTVNDALTTVASQTDPSIDDPALALNWLMDKWGTDQSVTVREALLKASFIEGGLPFVCESCGASYYGRGAMEGCCEDTNEEDLYA